MIVDAVEVSVTLGGRPVVREESVECLPGRLTALVGPSGSGKTTLLHTLGLLLPAASGSVRVDGVDTSGWNGARRRRFWRDHAAFILQDYGIMDEESVGFNVSLIGGSGGRRRIDPRVIEVLERTGLRDRQEELACHLSGGEKQRLAMARALFKSATAIFVDEPTASLDAENRRRMISLLAESADTGCTVVVSTHDEDMVSACSSRHVMGRAGAPRAGPATPRPSGAVT